MDTCERGILELHGHVCIPTANLLAIQNLLKSAGQNGRFQLPLEYQKI